MKEQAMIAERIKDLCRKNNLSYYTLSYKSAVPITTLMHIIDCSTKNPGIFTITKICNGFGITLIDFFDTEELKGIELEAE